MVTGAYAGNAASRHQIRGRLRRLGQKRKAGQGSAFPWISLQKFFTNAVAMALSPSRTRLKSSQSKAIMICATYALGVQEVRFVTVCMENLGLKHAVRSIITLKQRERFLRLVLLKI